MIELRQDLVSSRLPNAYLLCNLESGYFEILYSLRLNPVRKYTFQALLCSSKVSGGKYPQTAKKKRVQGDSNTDKHIFEIASHLNEAPAKKKKLVASL